MQRQFTMTWASLVGLVLIGMTGCGVWPFMTPEEGRRPFAMGKSDQILWPWAPHPIHLNEDYGLSYRLALENQIVNPAASNNLDPMHGAADARALQNSLARYQLMFKNPPYSEFRMQSGSGGSGSSGSTGNTSSGTGAGGSKK